MNVGVILYSKDSDYLKMAYKVDKQRLGAFPKMDIDLVNKHLESYKSICDTKGGGSILLMSVDELFSWIVAPRNTVIQCSSVHCGFCDDPEKELYILLGKMVIS